jgi:cystathionine beta-lyase
MCTPDYNKLKNPSHNYPERILMPIHYDFDRIIDRRHSDSLKWNYYDEDVIPMWVADMDFVSPQPVIDALKERIEHGVFGYPQGINGLPSELSEFRQLIVERLARLYDWQIQPQDIIFLPGVVKGFYLACHALASPDQAVMVQTPVYHPILDAAKTTGIQGREMELTRLQDGCYGIDWDAFKAGLSPQTRLFILCNPHNPVGKVFHKDELMRMAEICLRHGVVICSDEIHSDLVFSEHQHTPIASLDPEIANNTITLIAPSKTYNIAGLQCSFAIIQNEELRKRFLDARKGLVPWVNMMGMKAGETAYRHGQDWLEQVMVYLQANRDYLFDYLRKELPDLKMGMPEGTYLAWLDCRQAGIQGNPQKFFLEKGRVAFKDGVEFGSGGEGFVRLNFACPRAILKEGLQRIKKALQQR